VIQGLVWYQWLIASGRYKSGRYPKSICTKMAPSIVQNVTQTVSDLSLNPLKTKTLIKEPLKYSGSLDQFPHEDLTPALGTEFSTATQLSQLLKADNADELIRDLAILSIPKHHLSLTLQSPNVVSCFSVIRISISQLKSYLEPN